MTTTERISSILRKLTKEEKRISQVELAKEMKVSPASVNKWVTEGTISLDRIPRLCKVLGISPNELFGYEDPRFTEDAIKLYSSFLKYPEYHDSISKLLDLTLEDITENN